MNTINLTHIHYFGFIYLAFAHQTDGIYHKNEHSEVWKCTLKWIAKNEDHAEFARIMDEAIIWYKSRKNEENFFDDVLEIAERINEYTWFTMDKKIQGLKDLRKIALSDKHFLETERKWIRKIAEIWGIEIKSIHYLLK